jgi:hypothetical protein
MYKSTPTLRKISDVVHSSIELDGRKSSIDKSISYTDSPAPIGKYQAPTYPMVEYNI